MFRCLLVEKDSQGATRLSVTEQPLTALPAGDVLIRVAYSSLNYKDGLSSQGHPGVTRRFPHVPGIDAAGLVAESTASQVPVGSRVIVTGNDLGMNTWGGFAEWIRVPADWVLPVPESISLRESMIYGTAGLTAALSLDALQQRGLTPERGELVVTGATGGVGSVAVAIAARAGYSVVAASGKPAASEYLQRLGAARIVSRAEVCDPGPKPLLPPRWAGAIDTVGGTTLSTIIRATQPRGVVTACGLVGGHELPLTVYPFILRGVDLVGIDSVECPTELRRTIWERLAGAWRPARLDELVACETSLDELPPRIEQILAGRLIGRVVVRLAGEAI